MDGSDCDAVVLRQRVYRPYLDLGASIPEAPFHVIGLDWAIDAFLTARRYPFIQASVNESFRGELVTAPLGAYAVDSVRDIPSELWCPNTSLFVGKMDELDSLASEEGIAMIWALSRMGFHRAVCELVPRRAVAGDDLANPVEAELCYLFHWAQFRLWVDDPAVDYTPRGFRSIAEGAQPSRVKVDATYQMVMQTAKFSGDYDLCSRWQNRHERAIADYAPDANRNELDRLRSRYHRVGGFLPQMRQDKKGVTDEMAAAEEIIRSSSPADEFEEIARQEMLFPCLESRMQEALWIGDHDLAIARVTEYIEMKELDPKGWLHRANILVEMNDYVSAAADFAMAAALAPPGRSVALFMRGQCLAASDDLEGALDCYLRALDDDPLAISVVRAALDAARSLGRRATIPWFAARLEKLEAVAATSPEQAVEPYKSMQAPR